MRARALVIGINEYPEAASQSPLQGAVADAMDFALWARDPQGGAVAEDDLYFWGFPQPAAMPKGLEDASGPDRPWPRVRPNFASTPCKADIILAVEAMANLAATSSLNGKGHERLYVYLAGHGMMTAYSDHNRDPQNCLLAGDYHPRTALGLVPLDALRRLLERRGPEETLLIHDCCRNELPLSTPEPILEVPSYNDQGLNEKWAVGRSAKSGQVAFEVPLGNPTRGAFTKMLVQALRQYRVEGELTVDALKGFVRQGVSQLVHPRVQVPGFSVKDDDHPFVLVRGEPIGPLPEIVAKVPDGATGHIDILDAREKPVMPPVPIEGHEIRLKLPPGPYTLEHKPSGQYRSIFHFGPEETYVEL